MPAMLSSFKLLALLAAAAPASAVQQEALKQYPRTTDSGTYITMLQSDCVGHLSITTAEDCQDAATALQSIDSLSFTQEYWATLNGRTEFVKDWRTQTVVSVNDPRYPYGCYFHPTWGVLKFNSNHDKGPTWCCHSANVCRKVHTLSPSISPTTSDPTLSPSISPTTSDPTLSPSISPTTSDPTLSPSVSPTTSDPTLSPSISPSISPTTSDPTLSPTQTPTVPSNKKVKITCGLAYDSCSPAERSAIESAATSAFKTANGLIDTDISYTKSYKDIGSRRRAVGNIVVEIGLSSSSVGSAALDATLPPLKNIFVGGVSHASVSVTAVIFTPAPTTSPTLSPTTSDGSAAAGGSSMDSEDTVLVIVGGLVACGFCFAVVYARRTRPGQAAASPGVGNPAHDFVGGDIKVNPVFTGGAVNIDTTGAKDMEKVTPRVKILDGFGF